MPMGIVSDEDFVKEQNNSSVHKAPISTPTTTIPIPNDVIIEQMPSKGRGEGSTQVPQSLRKMLGETSEIEGRAAALELAGQFGISPSSVSAYANGATSTTTYNKPDVDITNHITNRKSKVSIRAMAKLHKALSKIDDDKLSVATGRELAGIAKDMAAVVKAMEPPTPQGPAQVNAPQFIFYAPQQRREESFETLYVKE